MMHLYNFIILSIVFETILVNSQLTKVTAQHKLIEYFLTIKNLNNAVLFNCWSLSGNIL